MSLLFALMLAVWRPSDGGGLMAGLEGRTLDARFLIRGAREEPGDIAILAIDDASLAALDAFPPPRDALARAMRVARDGGAVAVAFDLLLAGAGQGDDDLARVLEEEGGAILAVSLSETPASRDSDILDRAYARSALSLVINAPESGAVGMLSPAEDFARNATLAHVNIFREADGALRRIPLAMQAGDDRVLPALPLEAARRAARLERSDLRLLWGDALIFGDRAVSLNAQNEAGVNFYGPGRTIPTHSLITAQDAPLAGRVVFIGASARGFGDTFATPYDRELSGVEVLATMTANLLDGSVLRRDGATWGADILLALLAALACFLAASRARPLRAVVLTAVVWIGTLGIVQAAFVNALWLDGVTPLLSLLVATFAGGGARWMEHRRRAKNLAQYQSPLMSELLADTTRPAFDGRVQKAAALFVDAANFTPRTARLGPEQATEFLRGFHACVERAALAHGGVIEQYAGDGAMICFGLPEPGEDDARRALSCADQLFAEVEVMSAQVVSTGEEALRIRIGIHHGDVSVAVLGGRDHSHVTIVGDVVNLASRLQEVAKEIEAEMVVSDALITAAAGGADRHGLSPAGERILRGSNKPLSIWARTRQGRTGTQG